MQRYLKNIKATCATFPMQTLSLDHVQFLYKMRDEFEFSPHVIYDIGANLLHWTNSAKQVWPSAEIVLFDAYEPSTSLYEGYKNHVGVLSDTDGKVVKFFQSDRFPSENSYYKSLDDIMFPPDRFLKKRTSTLDMIVSDSSDTFPLPNLVKISVQGCDLDVLKGGQSVLKNATFLIVELQHTEYNKGTPNVETCMQFIESMKSGNWKCIANKFSKNTYSDNYCFVNLNTLKVHENIYKKFTQDLSSI